MKLLRHLVLTLFAGSFVLAASTGAAAPKDAAGNYAFLSASEFKKALEAGDFKKALSNWHNVEASFAGSPTGYALYSYLLFRNGLEVSGVEHLFLLKSPQSLSPEVRKLWQTAAPPTHVIWKLAKIRWTPAWKNVFAGFSGAENLPFQSSTLKSAKGLRELEQKIARTQPDSNERAWAQWQLALWAAVYDKTALAKKQIDAIVRNRKQTAFDLDQLRMAKARILFQEGLLKEALNEYLSIRKSSDYWLESLEERAWTYVRLGQPDRALGELRTLLSPVFTPQVGPEPLFLQAFINLKVCDYPQIFKSIDEFKARFRNRAAELQVLAQKGTTPAAEQAIQKLDSTVLSWNSVGVNSASLPRYFHRDEILSREMTLRQRLLFETETVRTLMEKNVISGSGLAISNLKTLMAQAPARMTQARQLVFVRLQVLAKSEVDEISQILQKMHIIEAEAIERIHRVQADQFKGKVQQAAQTDKDDLVFPVDAKNDELWMDELDKYRYQIKGCPNQGGREI